MASLNLNGAELIEKAKELCESFGVLLKQTTDVLAESQAVDQVMHNCCHFRNEQLYKHLVEHISNQEQLKLLNENSELKHTVEEYQNGIAEIMAKYKIHNNSDVLSESHGLRERYIGKLENVVESQNKRIENMAKIMQLTAELGDRESTDNKQTIQKLVDDNAKMRRLLQLNNNMLGMQNKNDCGTQIDLFEATLAKCADTQSYNSEDSFKTCYSDYFDDLPPSNSVSEGSINRFIEEALAETEDCNKDSNKTNDENELDDTTNANDIDAVEVNEIESDETNVM